jgi:hypothetical protein
MLLILKDLIPQLIPLLYQGLLFLLQLLNIAILPFPSQILLNLIGKMLIQILRHLQLLLHNLQLVL